LKERYSDKRPSSQYNTKQNNSTARNRKRKIKRQITVNDRYIDRDRDGERKSGISRSHMCMGRKRQYLPFMYVLKDEI
jgi:hypothetical protein